MSVSVNHTDYRACIGLLFHDPAPLKELQQTEAEPPEGATMTTVVMKVYSSIIIEMTFS